MIAKAKLGDISYIEMGQSPQSSTVNDRENGIPFLQGSAEFGDVFPKHKFYCTAPQKLCRTGDALMSVRAPVGELNKADQEYCIGRGLAAIRFTGVLPRFGWHMLNFWSTGLTRVAQGSTFEAINGSELANLEIVYFPENEQCSIADILDTIDSAIQNAERVIAKQKAIRAGLLHDLLTYGLDANGEPRNPLTHPEQFQESPLGLIPNEWEMVQLGDLGIWMSGGTPSRSVESYWNGSIPWVSPKDMKFFYLEDTIEHITEKGSINGTRLVPKNTVFIVVRGMILAHTFPVGIASRQMAFNQDMKALITNPQVEPKYIAYWLVANAHTMLALTTASTHGTKRLEFSELAKQIVALPALYEQEKILEILSVCDREIEILKAQYLKLISKKKGLMDDLLAGRVRVSDVQMDEVMEQK